MPRCRYICNRDGHLDIVAATQSTTNSVRGPAGGCVFTALNHGDGTFAAGDV